MKYIEPPASEIPVHSFCLGQYFFVAWKSLGDVCFPVTCHFFVGYHKVIGCLLGSRLHKELQVWEADVVGFRFCEEGMEAGKFLWRKFPFVFLDKFAYR